MTQNDHAMDTLDSDQVQTAERSILCLLVACELGMANADQATCAIHAWTSNKRLLVEQILFEQHVITIGQNATLITRLGEHLQKYGYDFAKANAACAVHPSLREQLQQVVDKPRDVKTVPMLADPNATIDPETERRPADPNATLAYSIRESNEASTTASPAPSSTSRYRILRPHARGGLGEVSVAQDHELHREVALKEIQARFAGDTESRLRFLLEAEITGALEHPGIVPIYGLSAYADGRPFYAMRFIEGESLEEAIEQYYKQAATWDAGKRSMQLRQLLRRFIDVCNAIEYAHSRGVLHRDIKPANIMLGKFGETLVVDWGLAKPLDQPSTASGTSRPYVNPPSASHSAATRLGVALGTPQFMSPEQAAGRIDQVGPCSDVYSLGATLYTLITGKSAFDGRDVVTIIRQVQGGDFPPPRQRAPQVARPLEAICLKAMAKEPANRYDSARAIADDLERWLADEAVTAYQEPWRERALRWARRNKSWTQAAAAALVLVAIVSTFAALLIDGAWDREIAAHQRADLHREEAEESFLKARHTVDDFFTRVSENKLLDVPGLQPLRRELLDAALKYYQGFIEQRSDDVKLRSELAATYYRLGLIKNEVDDKDKALASLRLALSNQDPKDDRPSARALRADIQNATGNVLQATGETTEAMNAFTAALELREKLVKEFPSDSAFERKLANSHNNIAVLAAQLGDAERAELEYAEANAARADLVKRNPTVAQFSRDLAQGRYNLAMFRQRRGDFKGAQEAYGEAIAIYRELVAKTPAVIDHLRELAITYRMIGDVQAELGDVKASFESLDAGRVIAEKLARANPFLVQLQADVAASYVSIGRLKQNTRHPDEASRWFEKSTAILQALVDDDAEVTRFQRDLAGSIVHQGMIKLAVRQLDEARTLFEKGHHIYSELARENPNDTTLQEALAQVDTDLGLVNRASGKYSDAIAVFQMALEIQQKLTKHEATRQKAQAGKADAYLNIAVELRSLKKPDEAYDALARAAELEEPLTREHPKMLIYRQTLAEILYLQGVIRFEQGRLPEALDKYVIVRDIREKLVEVHPENLDFQSALGTELDELGVVLWRLERDDEALEASRQATTHLRLAYDRSPDVAQYRQNLNSHLSNIATLERAVGRFDESAAATQQRIKLFPTNGTELAKAAGELALTAGAIGEEGRELTSAEQEIRLRFATQAAAAMRLAIAAGFKDVDVLKNEPRWKALESLQPLKELRDSIPEK